MRLKMLSQPAKVGAYIDKKLSFARWSLLCVFLARVTSNSSSNCGSPSQNEVACGCDGLSFVGASSPHAADHPVPVTHDECNGICSCCLFQGLPAVTHVLAPTKIVSKGIWLASPSPGLAAHPSVFRPPRA